MAIKEKIFGKPFQNFIFTVRDFELGIEKTLLNSNYNQEDTYGFDGGNDLLDSIVKKQKKDIDFSKLFEVCRLVAIV